MILELNFARLLSLWWSFTWRSMVWTFLFAVLIGGLGGVVGYLLGQPGFVSTVAIPLAWLATFPASLWALRSALLKRRKDFNIILLKNLG
ncbi:MAG: hypothetical protein RLZZ470_1134 [Pseudomonadota bacterium]|jgi:site-specific recombinase